MKPEPKKKLPNKKVISSAKFEAKEQFTKSALENLKTENERLVNSLKKSGEIKESKRKQIYSFKKFLKVKKTKGCFAQLKQNHNMQSYQE